MEPRSQHSGDPPRPRPHALVLLAQGSGEQAADVRALLIAAHRPLIAAVARTVVRSPTVRAHQRENIFQAGSLGLLKALARFDASKGVAFGSFSRKYVLAEVLAAIRNESWQEFD